MNTQFCMFRSCICCIFCSLIVHLAYVFPLFCVLIPKTTDVCLAHAMSLILQSFTLIYSMKKVGCIWNSNLLIMNAAPIFILQMKVQKVKKAPSQKLTTNQKIKLTYGRSWKVLLGKSSNWTCLNLQGSLLL